MYQLILQDWKQSAQVGEAPQTMDEDGVSSLKDHAQPVEECLELLKRMNIATNM